MLACKQHINTTTNRFTYHFRCHVDGRGCWGPGGEGTTIGLGVLGLKEVFHWRQWIILMVWMCEGCVRDVWCHPTSPGITPDSKICPKFLESQACKKAYYSHQNSRLWSHTKTTEKSEFRPEWNHLIPFGGLGPEWKSRTGNIGRNTKVNRNLRVHNICQKAWCLHKTIKIKWSPQLRGIPQGQILCTIFYSCSCASPSTLNWKHTAEISRIFTPEKWAILPLRRKLHKRSPEVVWVW